jgi:hypothetical protein
MLVKQLYCLSFTLVHFALVMFKMGVLSNCMPRLASDFDLPNLSLPSNMSPKGVIQNAHLRNTMQIQHEHCIFSNIQVSLKDADHCTYQNKTPMFLFFSLQYH